MLKGSASLVVYNIKQNKRSIIKDSNHIELRKNPKQKSYGYLGVLALKKANRR